MKSKVIDIINTCIEAVEESKFRKFLRIGAEAEGKITTMEINLVLSLVNCLCPKNIEGAMTVKEPKERW